MPQEIVSALVGFVVAAIGVGVAFAALLPSYVKRQMDIRQKAQENKIAEEQEKSKSAFEEAHQERENAEEQRKQFGRLIDSLISERAGQSQQQEVMIKALTNSVTVQGRQMEIMDAMAKELRANTNVTTEGVKEIGDLSNRIDELLDTGSKPLQKLTVKVDELGKNVASVVEKQNDTSEKVNFIHKQIVEINALKTSLEVMLSVAQAKLDDVRKATTESSTVNLTINPAT